MTPPTIRTIAVAVASIVALMGSIACAPRFDILSSGYHDKAATAERHGVRVYAEGVDRAERPCVCPELTPIQVTIRNNSDAPLPVNYDDFVLVTSARKRFAALPPFNLDATDAAPVPRYYRYPWSDFQLASHLNAYYRGFWNSSAPSPPDATYYDTNYAKLAAVTQPTAEMFRATLPEGTLEPDGYITGLLFFQTPLETQVTFRADFAAQAPGRGLISMDVPVALRDPQ